ncbi:hypothetical protein [Jidongwangia harbinensis]|uniref:hypothetical protein n=1 Tax=Jidongwangia harbinensis TaxID=2878561 RepID=UPI001CDA439A|nr:hypothetical protein [Jidongwangia harbinensis]MCA2215144.1 hypothetical protein [Jidongwangia harbinensis]
MTTETIDAPPSVRVPAAPVPPVPPAPRFGILWRRTLRRSVLVPLTVLAPLVALAPTADHRYNLYWHGGMFAGDPAGIVRHTLGTVDTYLRLGNFRPLGRMLEKSLDLAAYALTSLLGLPVNVSFRLVSFVSAVVLTVAAVMFAECLVNRGRLFRQAPSRLAATVPFAAGAGLVAAGSASPVVLFGGTYLLSGALVLGVAAAVCRVDRERRRIGRWRGGLLLLGGAALASFNEIAYLALPFATVAVLVRGLIVLLGHPRQVLTGAPARVIALLWLGFLPVFGVVRAVIYSHCADGACYRGSDVALGPDVLAAAPVRMVAWLPPLMWRTATEGGRPWLGGLMPVLALVVLAGLGWRAIRDLPRLSGVDRRQIAGVIVSAVALIVLGGTLGGLNADVQALVADGRWGQGWRDTAVTAAAGALLLTALGHAVLTGPRFRRAGPAVLIVVLAASGVVTAAANKRYADRLGAGAPAQLANRVAGEMARFDRSAAGNARRCALRQEFRIRYADSAFSLRRFDESLDVAAQHLAGVRFCA